MKAAALVAGVIMLGSDCSGAKLLYDGSEYCVSAHYSTLI